MVQFESTIAGLCDECRGNVGFIVEDDEALIQKQSQYDQSMEALCNGDWMNSGMPLFGFYMEHLCFV